jgi:hypothetical protein
MTNTQVNLTDMLNLEDLDVLGKEKEFLLASAEARERDLIDLAKSLYNRIDKAIDRLGRSEDSASKVLNLEDQEVLDIGYNLGRVARRLRFNGFSELSKKIYQKGIEVYERAGLFHVAVMEMLEMNEGYTERVKQYFQRAIKEMGARGDSNAVEFLKETVERLELRGYK